MAENLSAQFGNPDPKVKFCGLKNNNEIVSKLIPRGPNSALQLLINYAGATGCVIGWSDSHATSGSPTCPCGAVAAVLIKSGRDKNCNCNPWVITKNHLWTVGFCLERSLGKWIRRSRNQWRKAPFHWMRARHSMNDGLGNELYTVTGKASQWRGRGHSVNCRTLEHSITEICFKQSEVLWAKGVFMCQNTVENHARKGKVCSFVCVCVHFYLTSLIVAYFRFCFALASMRKFSVPTFSRFLINFPCPLLDDLANFHPTVVKMNQFQSIFVHFSQWSGLGRSYKTKTHKLFAEPGGSNKENPSAYWYAALSGQCPCMASNDVNSYLVPISFWSLSGCWPCLGFFFSYLVLQACISFRSVSDRSGASLFLPCSHKNVVAHMVMLACFGAYDRRSPSSWSSRTRSSAMLWRASGMRPWRPWHSCSQSTMSWTSSWNGTTKSTHTWEPRLETFLADALYREFRENHARILMPFLGKSTEIHHNSHKRPKRPNYDGFWWIFPRSGIRIHMIFRNSLYNAPASKVSNKNAEENITQISRGTSRPNLGHEVYTLFSFIFQAEKSGNTPGSPRHSFTRRRRPI